MLILSRKINESIQIGENIKITVIQNKEGRMQIGIEAPKDLKILRTELIEKEKCSHQQNNYY